jgi:hypothetical protein
MTQHAPIPRVRKLFVLRNKFDQRSIEIFDAIQVKNVAKLQKKKKRTNTNPNQQLELVELDIVTYKVDDEYFVTEKKDCIQPTPSVDTKPEQILSLEKLLGIERQYDL